MSYNKILVIFTTITVTIMVIATTVSYCWEDHPDVGMIDHLFDFHIDYDHVLADADKEIADKKAHAENIASWVRDLAFEGYDAYEGSYGVPDRDR